MLEFLAGWLVKSFFFNNDQTNIIDREIIKVQAKFISDPETQQLLQSAIVTDPHSLAYCKSNFV